MKWVVFKCTDHYYFLHYTLLQKQQQLSLETHFNNNHGTEQVQICISRVKVLSSNLLIWF